MPQYDIGNAKSSDLTNVVTDATINTQTTDGISQGQETEWQNPNWTQYWGDFLDSADLKSAILLKATWIVGKGWKADIATTAGLDNIRGWGQDSFDDIIFNMEVIKRVNGDAFAEIIRNPKTGTLINLKPLDPGSIKIIVGSNGIIKRYEQTTKLSSATVTKKTFKPQDIFHLSHNRVADQIHGISDIVGLQSTLLAEKESFDDTRTIMHRQARPLMIFKLKTDDEAEISAFITKMDTATRDGENLYVPHDDNAFEVEVVQVNPSSMVLAWRNDIRNKFYRNIGLPQIVPGAGGLSTESESKVIYFAFEQMVEKDQRFLELQLWNQLGIKINFIPPATLATSLQGDEAKDGDLAVSQPADTQVSAGA